MAIKKEFKNKGAVKLDYFIDQRKYKKIEKIIKKLKFKQIKIPDKFSYSTPKSNINIKKLLGIGEIKNFIRAITNKNCNLSNLSIKKFKHKDYSIMHDSKKTENNMEFIFFICKNWNPMWGSNRVCVKNEKTFLFTPKGNSLVFINKKKITKDFTQYVNRFAKKSEIIIIGK